MTVATVFYISVSIAKIPSQSTQSYVQSLTSRRHNENNTFASERDKWFADRGIELTLWKKYISLYIPLGFNEFEIYHVITGKDGLLDVSEAVWWQVPYCFNNLINIFTGESVDE